MATDVTLPVFFFYHLFNGPITPVLYSTLSSNSEMPAPSLCILKDEVSSSIPEPYSLTEFLGHWVGLSTLFPWLHYFLWSDTSQFHAFMYIPENIWVCLACPMKTYHIDLSRKSIKWKSHTTFIYSENPLTLILIHKTLPIFTVSPQTVHLV